MRLGLAALAACGLLAVVTATASAGPAHKPAGQFDLPGLISGSGIAGNFVAQGLAVQQTSGNYFVLDSGTQRVLHVSEGGSLLDAFGAGSSPDAASATYNAVAAGAADDGVYVVDQPNFVDRLEGAIDHFDSDGTFLNQIDGSDIPVGAFYPFVAAVSATTGSVYAAAAANDTTCNPDDPVAPPGVYVFDATGAYQSFISATGTDDRIQCPLGVAVDSTGRVYVWDLLTDSIKRFTAAGAFDGTIYAGGIQGFTIDQASDRLFILTGSGIVETDADGTPSYTFAAGQFGGSTSLGVNGANHRVSAIDPGGAPVRVTFFGPFTAPDVTTDPFSDLTPTSVTMNGSVDPLGIDGTSYHFEWGLDTSYGTSTGEVGATGAGPVSEPLTGLLQNTTYHYRLVATNPDGSNAGVDQSFTTPTIPPIVSGEAIDNLRAFSVILKGSVNPNNAATNYHFEWGTDTSYGNSVPVPPDPPIDLGSDPTDHPVTTTLTGLDPSTEYHWRIVADNSIDPAVNGADQTFTTLPPPPSATIGAVSGVTTTSATFHASVDTVGLEGTYHFTVTAGNSAFSEATTPVDIPAAPPGSRDVTATLDGLPSGSPLHVQATIVTAGGSATTEAADFSTPGIAYTPPTPPPPDTNPYGCAAPHLNAYKATAKPGKVITLTGSDLGVGGVVNFGSTEVDTPSWAANAVRAEVPSSAKGTVAVTLNCSKASNTISVKVAKAKKPLKCKKGYAKKKVKGKTRCVKKKKHRK